jgi:aminodeoxyfutalosine deaminase
MKPRDHTPEKPVLRIDALEVLDAQCVRGRRCLLAEKVDKLSLGWRILACGQPEDVGHHPAAPHARRIELPRSIVIPGLVNAHTHLDLTHIGPQPHDPDHGFVPWVDMVRQRRRSEHSDIADSVRRGIELSVAGGTIAVGDIAGAARGQPTLAPWETLLDSPLIGVSYIETFGMGLHRQSAAERLESFINRHRDAFTQRGRVRLGLQPHAPNTIELPHYHWIIDHAERLDVPLCTHLAETPEERRFIAQASGPQRELLERLGVWHDSILEHIGRGLHPVRHIESVLARRRFIAAHCNDATDEAIDVLARTGTSVAYCPRASSYFGAHRHFGSHRYRDMLAAGVNVCLGTDSIINLPPGAARPERGISILDEMRLLHRRDGTPPLRLLEMATTNGAAALGLDPGLFLILDEAPLAALLAIPADTGVVSDPLEAALTGDAPPQVLW